MFRPDGWLGLLLGSKLWFDYSDAFATNNSSSCNIVFKNLCKELDRHLGRTNGAQASIGTSLPDQSVTIHETSMSTIDPLIKISNCITVKNEDNWSNEYLHENGVYLSGAFGKLVLDSTDIAELRSVKECTDRIVFIEFLIKHVVSNTSSAFHLCAIL